LVGFVNTTTDGGTFQSNASLCPLGASVHQNKHTRVFTLGFLPILLLLSCQLPIMVLSRDTQQKHDRDASEASATHDEMMASFGDETIRIVDSHQAM